MTDGRSRWSETPAPRGDEYDARWRAMAARGENPHGEADFVSDLLQRHGVAADAAILDGGCGTGRVGLELARRGFRVVGVDLDDRMLEAARSKPGDVEWFHDDLATVQVGRTVDAVVLAGNVMIFLAPGTEGAVVANLAAHLVPQGFLIAGFQLGTSRLALATYDRLCADAGLEPVERWATWARRAFTPGDNYTVSVHRLA